MLTISDASALTCGSLRSVLPGLGGSRQAL